MKNRFIILHAMPFVLGLFVLAWLSFANNSGAVTFGNSIHNIAAKSQTPFRLASITKASTTISDLEPNHGYAPIIGTPGTIVTLTGTGFTGTSLVRFNGRSAGALVENIATASGGYQIVSDTEIKVIVPADAISGKIIITTPKGIFSSPENFTVAPRLTSCTPTGGPPGSIVTLSGFNMSSVSQVAFGAVSVGDRVDDITAHNSGFQIISPYQVKVRVPAEATTSKITVTNSFGDSATVGPFTVSSQISSLVPLHGYAPTDTVRATLVTLTGRSFTGSSALKFNGISVGERVEDISVATSGYQIIDDTQIKALVPAGAATGKISLNTPTGTISSADTFTVAPRLTVFSPLLAPVGSIITLFGYNLSSVTAIEFNGINAGNKVDDITLNSSGFQVISSFQVRVRVPAGATNSKIKVVNSFGDSATTSSDFKVLSTFTGIEPNHGYAPFNGMTATIVTLTGSGLGGVQQVKFNGLTVGEAVADIESAATGFQIVSDSQIKAWVPANATTGRISLTTASGNFYSSESFTVAPRLTIFTPALGKTGTVITLFGYNLSNTSRIEFDGVAVGEKVEDVALSDSGFQIISPSQVKARVPAEAATGKITVFNSFEDTASTTAHFKVVSTLTSFEPNHGYASEAILQGTVVALTGSGLRNVSAVKFNGLSSGERVEDISATPAGYQIVDGTQIKVVVPPNATTGKISIVTPSGTLNSAETFTVAPRLTTFFPTGAPISSILTLYGYNLSTITTIEFQGTNPEQPILSVSERVSDLTSSNNGFQIISPFQIRVRVPASAINGKIKVINSFGDSAVTHSEFKVLSSITNIEPNHGHAPASGLPGTVVTIHGTYLNGTSKVHFNGTSVGAQTSNIDTSPSGFQVINDTQIKAIVPLGATTGKISLATPKNVATSGDVFTVGPRNVEIRMPALFNDSMVLQQGVRVPIWGEAAAGQQITVSFAGQVQQTVADDKGAWSVTLEPLPVIQSEVLRIQANSEIAFRNVAVGEVWLCSGQSNMALLLSQSENVDAALQEANDPGLRLFQVTNAVADEPQKDVKGAWFPADTYSAAPFSAVAYYYGKELRRSLNVPIGLIMSSQRGSAAEAWTTEATLQADADLSPIMDRWARILASNPALTNSIQRPAGLFNAMIAPLAPYSMRGVIWYQGEGNVPRAYQYRKLLPAMMADWRRAWGAPTQDFPFHVVQLPNYGTRKTEPAESALAELREAQALSTFPELRSGNGLSVNIDTGDGTIHPPNKSEVARRIALVALAKTYGHQVEFVGPCFDSMHIEGDKIRLHFTHADGLTAIGSSPDALPGFAVAGADRQWQWAAAEIRGNDIIVSNSAIAEPVAVRYAWGDNPVTALYNGAGLPAMPFRTDDWPGMTINVK